MFFTKYVAGKPRKLITALHHLRSRKNFNWIVSWEITNRCNLRCRYCNYHLKMTDENIYKASERVAQLKPKYLIITGGEPLILPEIASITRDTHTRAGKPFLIFNSNATKHLERLFDILDIMNTLHVSLDGLGEINAITRGIDGDRVLDNIKRIDQEIKKRQTKTALLTMTVVTKTNYRSIPEMVNRVFKEVPGCFMSLGSVEPIWSEFSIVQDEESLRWFMNEMQPLAEQYPHHLILVGPLAPGNYLKDKIINSDAIEAGRARHFVNCKRQFFRITVRPDGSEARCKPSLYYDNYHAWIKNEMKEKRYFKALTTMARLLDILVLRPYSTFCPFPCKCEEFLDDILNNVKVPEIELLAGRFSREELIEVSRFCKAHWKQGLSDKMIEALLTDRNQTF